MERKGQNGKDGKNEGKEGNEGNEAKEAKEAKRRKGGKRKNQLLPAKQERTSVESCSHDDRTH